MMVTGEIREFEPGMFSLMLEPCSAFVLPHILDEQIPFVFLMNHRPNRYLQWYETNVQLRKDGESFSVEARTMTLDLQMPTKRFLELLSEFADSGLRLMQFERKLPDTLEPQYLKDGSKYKILRQNGLYLDFYLPHAREYASVITPHREVLERIKNNPIIASENLP
ncbi:MAG: hypothetical protein K1X72_06525 [Pyrinomonadaceae bacterium]|nr:hypothetical protein [Pyrinomonadaceae bacterium]